MFQIEKGSRALLPAFAEHTLLLGYVVDENVFFTKFLVADYSVHLR